MGSSNSVNIAAAMMGGPVALPGDPNRNIDQVTSEILFYKAQVGTGILEIGRRLTEAKDLLPHGEWLPWLREKVDFSERAAQQFMLLSREYSNPQLVADLGVRKSLALLAVPSDEREVFARTHNAVQISVKEFEKTVKSSTLLPADSVKDPCPPKPTSVPKSPPRELLAALEWVRARRQGAHSAADEPLLTYVALREAENALTQLLDEWRSWRAEL